MHLIHRYRLYKKALIFLMVANGLILSFAIVESINYYNLRSEINQELAALPQLQKVLDQTEKNSQTAILIGFLTFLFGIALPSIVLYKLNLNLLDLRQKTEKQFISWLNWWLKNYGNIKDQRHTPFYNRPDFWLNVALLALEAYGPNSKNPILNYFGELAPLVRHEISQDKAS